jgi:predicted transcriptional regulator
MFNGITPVQYVSDACNINSLLSTKSNSSLPLVIFYMNFMKVEAAGVVDEQNHCIGFIISEDLIDFSNSKKKNKQYSCIADVMRVPNMSVYLDDPIEQALIMMRLHKVDWLPVIDFDTQHFSGLICRKDIENLPTNIIAFPKEKFSYGNAA